MPLPPPQNASVSGRKRGPEDFQRAYKACINCRQRKAKCILSNDGGKPGPSCQRCQREMRDCVFRPERSWTKRRKDGTSDLVTQQSSDGGTLHSGETVGQASPKNDRLPANGFNSTGAREYKASPERQVRRLSTATQPAGLASSVMRTVVSSGKDALNLLFEAAHHRDVIDSQEIQRQAENGVNNAQTAADSSLYETPQSTMPNIASPFMAHPVRMSKASRDVLKVWNSCRFVQMGWFSAEEAVTYVDLFFRNLSPLSPILSDYYSNHSHHSALISAEPFLCSTILMISSRYNVLPGVGGASRGYFIHDRLWEHCQRFVMRIMLGQEKASSAKTRTIGSIEALLLISEWHPRALHFPTASDGWDCDLMVGAASDQDEEQLACSLKGESASGRWLEDVIEPARRSDRMSWMLLGCALSLAHELGLFEENGPEKTQETDNHIHIDHLSLRRIRARKLLYVFIEQLSSRLGCTSMIPQSLNHALMAKIPSTPSTRAAEQWQSFMSAWIELTKLAKSVSDMLFPSASFTRQILRSGRYIGLLGHFQPLLNQWWTKHLDPHKLEPGLLDMLSIEYQYVRIYTNSLGMQAVVERTLAENDVESLQDETLPMTIEPTDYEFIREVVDGSCQILQKVSQLAESGALRYSPVRIFLRITTSSIYLIKGLSLGVRNTKLQTSLDILDRAISALRSSTLDDMHLASRYATLLELHVARLRGSFIISSRPPRLSTRSASADRTATSGMEFLNNQNAGGSGIAALAENVSGMMSADDWLALPFDPSMAPFGQGGVQAFQGLDDGSLDFIWNLPT